MSTLPQDPVCFGQSPGKLFTLEGEFCLSRGLRHKGEANLDFEYPYHKSNVFSISLEKIEG
jgi:hypothetical protein